MIFYMLDILCFVLRIPAALSEGQLYEFSYI